MCIRDRSRSEAFISRFAKVYTPSVCGAALVLGIAVPLLRLAFGAAPNWTDWIYRALTFLVVSCPCLLYTSKIKDLLRKHTLTRKCKDYINLMIYLFSRPVNCFR